MTDPLIPILRQVADELARREAPPVVVPLTVGELPVGDAPHLPCLWLDADGRPHPVLGYQWNERVHAFLAFNAAYPNSTQQSIGGRWPAGPVLYPESAAPALWERFLAARVGRVG